MKFSPCVEGRQAELMVRFGRQVDHDQPVDAGRHGIAQEVGRRVDVDRIVIAHEHDRRLGVALAEGAHQLEGAAHGLARAERPLRRGLDRRAVGHRIGERHAELDHVGAGLRQPHG